MNDEDWELLKCDRRVQRGMRVWEDRVRQEIKVGGAKVISSYNHNGKMVFRRSSDPCSFDRPGVWPKVFKRGAKQPEPEVEVEAAE